jgi:DNA-binding MarR family transcriptional regulator
MITEEQYRLFGRRHPLRLLHLAHQKARIEAERLLQDMDLSAATFPYLLALYWQDGQSQRQLSEITLRDPGSTVRCLDQLENKGLVERRTNPNDRRLWHVYLTERGKEIQEDLMSRLTEVRRAALSGFNGSETDQFVFLLEKVISNLDGEKGPAGEER